MNRSAALQRLLRPRSIAFIGGDSAAEALRQCLAIGFDGDVWAVNPNRESLAGVPCAESLDSLPTVPDASFIAAPPQQSLAVVEQLAMQAAPGAVCFAAGFAETGVAGAKLQSELRAAARDMAVIGPNCHGFVNYLDGVALWPDQHGGQRAGQGVALIAQSGNIAINLTMQQRGLDFSYVLSVGNNCVLGLHDYIDALLADSRVTAIGLHIEGIDDVAEFSAAAIRALQQQVPLVALKSGRSSRGADITMSHTASLAGPDRLYDALFERLGVARCDTLAQFLETLKLVSIGGLPRKHGVASMSCSGGDAALVADAAERLGMPMPDLQDSSVSKLQALLGDNVHVANPLDYHLYVWGDYEKLRICFAEILSQAFACTLLVLDYPHTDPEKIESWLIAERALKQAMADTGALAVIVASLPETMPASVRARLKKAGIAPMQGIDDCLFAVRGATAIGAAQARAETTSALLPPGDAPSNARLLDEWQSKAILQTIGIATPAGHAGSADEVIAAAGTLGFPVVLKAIADNLAHKTEQSAVILDVRDENALRLALESMQDRFDRFLIERQIGAAVAEFIVGVSRDTTFGASLLVGSGGTLVELIDDTVSLLLPVQRDEIDSALNRLKATRQLSGFRGRSRGDRAALMDAIERIGHYAETHSDSLGELDVNPLLVLADGVVAVDATIRCSDVL